MYTDWANGLGCVGTYVGIVLLSRPSRYCDYEHRVLCVDLRVDKSSVP